MYKYSHLQAHGLNLLGSPWLWLKFGVAVVVAVVEHLNQVVAYMGAVQLVVAVII
jgi:hypothetical protein